MSRAGLTITDRESRERAKAAIDAAPAWSVVTIRGSRKEPLDARFWRNVEFDTNGGCWLWSGHAATNGYGQLSVSGRMVMAHRLAHQLFVGPLPAYRRGGDPLVLMHSCDNPLCVNPGHLSLGRQSMNIADRVFKGRCGNGRHVGEAHPAAKITAETVRRIRSEAGEGNDRRAIAARHGVSPSNVSMIVSRRTWGHVQ